ncbi:MAG: cache domain-containing protein [Caldilineaceae bacterium]|nr:cache domain-containing protein [Caldilineaceae bacterium]
MTDYSVSRRAFLKTAGVAALGIGLAACQPIPPMADGEAAMGEVTAADVTDPESLEAWVLGSKARFESITDMNVFAKLREGLKTEGYWKSGSTFLIIFLMNGDAFIHGNDREAERKNLMGLEDERGTKVVEELFAAAADGGGFVEYHDDGLKTAYAVEYISGITGRRFVLVGGLSKDVSDVPITIADLPKPPVTASEVVDRETLIAFVDAAAETYQQAVLSEGYSALTGVRNAFRVEGGDWKSGSIYLYVVSGGGVTLFHGSEPFREGQTTDMTRTDSKGVRFAELLIGVARREGKSFLRYHYDNPAIEGDEETGSPKFGYAVSFPVPNSDQRGVIGSGIYVDEGEE